MRSIFSINWLSSIQPRKQRKFRHNAPLHIKGNFFNVRLSKELQEKHHLRSLRVRSGDKVKILRGQFKGLEGLVDKVSLSRERVFVKGAEIVKKEGGKVPYPIHPSNLRLISINSEDKKRIKITKKEN